MTDYCLLIPVYNHPLGIQNTLAKLACLSLPCIVVDDGSEAACRDILDAAARQYAWVSVLRHKQNRGKGAAVKTGLRHASTLGYSHAVQLDADEQHDSTALPAFIRLSRQHPDSVILGVPVYDQSVPRLRLLSRYLTHVWVWINTLSRSIPDAMCGFRVYPLAQCLELLERNHLGDRMDFDIEVLVKLHWQGARFACMPVNTCYPQQGVSHFRLLEDNWLITKMHTRLFFGMLRRVPHLLHRSQK